MDAPYQARDKTPVMRAGSGATSICGMMSRKVVEVKRELLPSLTASKRLWTFSQYSAYHCRFLRGNFSLSRNRQTGGTLLKFRGQA